MSDIVEKKKKLYKVATELNLSHETLIEFLRKKGHEVKGHMSSVDEPMMRDILIHFKKEKDVAEKHQRKIQEIRETKKRAERKAVEERAEAGGKVTAAAQDAKPVTAEAEPVTAELEVEVSTLTGVPGPEGAPSGAVEPAAGEEAGPAAEPVAEEPHPAMTAVEEVAVAPPVAEAEHADEPVAAEEAGEAQLAESLARAREKGKKPEPRSPLEIQKERSGRMGLTIKGKMDLAPKRPAPGRGAKATAQGPPAKAAPTAAESDEHKKKKKKKHIGAKDAVEVKPVEAEEGSDKKKKKKKKLRHKEVNQTEVKDAIRRTFAAMDDSAVSGRAVFKKKKRREREEEEARAEEEARRESGILRVTEFVSVNDLANLMHVNVAEVIKKCLELGIMVSINQRLEKDTITLVADEFGYQVEFISAVEDEGEIPEIVDGAEVMLKRAPVVTIMGHVDHGKTSLLDFIRRSNVVAGEAGGITQHIGAYEVTTPSGNKITFLDTPGHEAFTAMRARGAQITDIVVLVIAADDSVMPQTLEAISHARAAAVPIIIAINKTDKQDANPERIRQQSSERDILVEEWGGKYQCVELSAKTGKNVDLLLEKIILEADVLDLKANPNRLAYGTIVEAQLDKGKGIIATILVQKGTLRIGDPFIGGIYSGKVRAMYDERDNRLEVAGPSCPVQLTGLDGIPQAGDTFVVLDSDVSAREISLRRQQLKREQDFRQVRLTTLDDISQQIKDGQVKELGVIVKGDVDGSVEALADSLMKIQHKEVKLRVIHSGVGTISESDVMLATASGAVIIGFRVRPNLNARRLAEKEKVDIRMYTIIYDAIEDIHKALEGMLSPEKKEEIMSTIEIRALFKVPKVGNIAGCYVLDGKIARNHRVRLLRDGIQIFEGTISSLKRLKDDVREVESGFECGIGLENFNDVKVGDTIESFRIVESKRKL
jgi:translation initiation factor IF-2